MPQFGRYVLHRKIAQGGMGEVFFAEVMGAQGFAKKVALKRIFPHLSEEPKYRELFIKEAKIASELLHPNMVQVFDLGEEDGQLYLAMELVNGPSLSQLRQSYHDKGETFPVQLATIIAFDILEALDFLHQQRDNRGRAINLLHRDISPQNILVSAETGFAKVCDFGLVWLSLKPRSHHKQQTIYGKLLYISPEQYTGSLLTPASDLYALGLVIYELLTGPEKMQERARQLTTFNFDPVSLVGDDDAIHLWRHILKRVLQQQPEHRFVSAAEFREPVEDYLAKMGPRRVRNELKEICSDFLVPEFSTSISEVSSPVVEQTNATEISTAVDHAVPRPYATERWTNLLRRTEVNAREIFSQALTMPSLPPTSTGVPPWWRHPFLGWILALVVVVLVYTAYELLKLRRPGLSVAEVDAQSPPVDGPPLMPPLEDEFRAKFKNPIKESPSMEPPQVELQPRLHNAKGQGTLNINATPWAYVALDGKKLKATPILGLRLPSGRHQIVLTGPSGNSKTIVVDIRANTTTTKIVTMDN